MNVTWTDARVERAKALWAAHWSAGDIAADLGGVTRNAVIGKLTRLGFTRSPTIKTVKPRVRDRRATFAASTPPSLPEAPTAPIERAKCTLGAGKPSSGFYTGCMIRDGACTDSGWQCDGSGNLTRNAGGVSLMQLTNTTCRWPSGVVGAADFCYCGGPADLVAGRPYCAEHTRVARRST